ncbi:MAG: D-aminoacylase [Acidobacteriota bacterium]|nr:D-aminoacylase [Acidobacteriota bacterium]
MSRLLSLLCSAIAILALAACATPEPQYDILIRNGRVIDGTGAPGVDASLAIRGDRVVAIGPLADATARETLDATGLVVAPGFINMLSWADEPLLVDGRSQGNVRQGVTLEVFGEGWSMGPLNERMKTEQLAGQGDLKFPIDWTTLGEYLDGLIRKGVSTNVASFVGATTLRIHEIGYEDRDPTAEELERMKELVRRAMREGALGVGSSLIYAPAFYAKTPELVALARAAGESGGMYISHMRSEGSRLLEAIDELIQIARDAGVPAEIYHLKAAGRENWDKTDAAIARIEAARREGLRITADVYTYPAGATGLNATMPPWVQEGGHDRWVSRLRDPATRARVMTEMTTPTTEWENFFVGAGPEGILLSGFKTEALKPLTGQTLAQVAKARGTSPEETAINLVIEDGSRVEAVYFLMSEDNLRKKLRLPWVSFGSDSGSMAPEGVFLRSNPHPRAYGNFARWLGRYVRDEELVPLEEAIRRMTTMPAEHLSIKERGRLAEGYFADVVVFDPARIQDHATFERPHQYATGVVHVLVNGTPVLRAGEHTGATPGRVVRGPGYEGGRLTP